MTVAAGQERSTPRVADLSAYVVRPHVVVACLVVYYWGLAYSRPSGALDALGAAHYAAFVVPLAVFVAFWAVYRVSARVRLQAPAFVLLMFVGICGIVGVARGDLATVFSAGLAFATAAALLDLPVGLPRPLVNALFLLSLPVAQICFATGWSQYGIIPWTSEFLEREGLAWRISLFPSVPESAFVALLVFVINQRAPRSPFRWLMLALSLYFLVLSGLRTALVAFVLIQAYFWIFERRRAALRIGYLATIAVALPLLAVLTETVRVLPLLGDGALAQYILRTSAANVTADATELSLSRLWIWTQHVSLFTSSPLLGVGTYDFDAAFVAGEAQPLPTTGSESWLTSWLARTGATFALVLLALAWVAVRAARHGRSIAVACGIAWYVASLAYGSVLAPYDIVSILLIAGMSEWKRGADSGVAGLPA